MALAVDVETVEHFWWTRCVVVLIKLFCVDVACPTSDKTTSLDKTDHYSRDVVISIVDDTMSRNLVTFVFA